MNKPLPWMLEYPTVATVSIASFETLAAWDTHLPEPTSDVERTVRRRISARMAVLWRGEVQRVAPDVDAALKKIEEKVAELLRRAGR